jgi:hypothetical protein
VLRIVLRNGLSTDLADGLLDDLRVQVQVLSSHPQWPAPLIPGPTENRVGFAH